MVNFNQGDNNKTGGFNRKDSGRPNFQKNNFGGGKSFGNRGPVTMYKAVCDQCKKACEVPFRPTEGKPVYCNDCFGKKRESSPSNFPRKDFGGNRQGDNRDQGFPKRDFNQGVQSKPSFSGNTGNDDTKKQLEMVNIKLDKLIRAIESMTIAKPVEIKPEKTVKKAVSSKVKKSSKKK